MLLRFRVANHRSIRNEQELSLVEVPKRGEDKPKAGEIPPTVQVAGIYGSNASGKSNVLDALRWMSWAVRTSYTRWEPEGGVPRYPFLLDDDGPEAPSFFEVDILHYGTRYTYGFEVDDTQVREEWLYAYPRGRPQRWFERKISEDGDHVYHFGRSLKGKVTQTSKLTRSNSLFLSAGASHGNDQLSVVYQGIRGGFRVADQNVADQDIRASVTRSLLADSNSSAQVFKLIGLADLGVTGWRLEERDYSEALKKTFSESYETLAKDLNLTSRKQELLLLERGEGEYRRALSPDQESDGTKAWLGLVGPLVEVFRSGASFLVDEIDSSLHPMISSTVLKMFKDPEVNPKGAQLIFASHDTTLLGHMLDSELLRRDEVWFTEKDAAGATELYSLAEFHPRGEENFERGYLQGRYGAVPYVPFEDIRSVFADLHKESDESSSSSKEEPRSEYTNA
ncbi:AAA family ATPase [Streptomonospora salina]|uniref:ATPase AAA-type core domain-containing protein n=1 Tax=Streptomonospora salina TaxID=104205 RepID=A0A841E9C6_9ACTN|nr:ATP-binding protein [Streptomonospora salina]MBB5999725.1 hypothetical protein [Streptomonospora salina]